MEKEKSIKQLTTVYTKIMNELADPCFRFSEDEATTEILSKFLDLFENTYNAVTEERLVDFCVSTAYTYRRGQQRTIQQMFSLSALKRVCNNKRGRIHYEDKWLSGKGLSREYLINLIAPKENSLARFFYMPSEELTKRRLLNLEVGYFICQIATLGWSPASSCCAECVFVDKCKETTQRKLPDLYQIRIEYEKSNA
jgi:hypothetical protein